MVFFASMSQSVYPANREAEKFRRGRQTELLLDVGAVHIHGLGTQMNFSRDFLGAPTLAKKTQHLHLAIRKSVLRRAGLRASVAGNRINNSRGHARADKNSATQHHADGMNQFFRSFVLHQEAAPSR